MRHLVVVSLIIILCFVMLLSSCAVAFAHIKKIHENSENQKNNPYKIIRVYDGDTVKIKVDFLPDPMPPILGLRIDGIDTPEKGHRAKCGKERLLSAKATRFTNELLAHAQDVRVVLHGWGKYAGRIVGDIIVDGKKFSQIMVDRGFAVWYDGGKKVKDWCE